MSSTGIYIHIPFCKAKCPYCDFYSIPISDEMQEQYFSALYANLQKWGKKIKNSIDTVYFGGGTPSLVNIRYLTQTMETIQSNFHVADNCETTIEVNPFTYQTIDFECLKKHGINRLSIGLQSANDNELKVLGRLHSATDAYHTVKEAQKYKFDNISLDLMIGTPEQTKSSLSNSIEFCKDCNVQHISSYILKIEKNTPFYSLQGKLSFKNDDEQSDFYLHSCNEIQKYGYKQYEISNYAIPGYESKHNLKYWNCHSYLGLGPSAHSMIDNRRFHYPSSLSDFASGKIINDGAGNTPDEFIMMQLRLSKGLDLQEYQKRYQRPFSNQFFQLISEYEKHQLLIFENNIVKLTPKGFLLSNAIIGNLVYA